MKSHARSTFRYGFLVAAMLIAAESPSRAQVPPPANYDAVEVPDTPDSTNQRWSSFLPFMKEEAIARGHELPLPFGVSVIYNYVGRDIDVFDVRIGIDGAAPQSVSEFFDLGSTSSVNAALLKLDAWLLPFLNLYMLGGYLENESISNGRITMPGPAGLEFDVEIPTSLSGFVLGAGTSVAAGYGSFFLMGDANYSKTDIGFEDNFRAIVISTRAGWFGKLNTVPVRFWLGGAYWDTVNTARSTVEVPGVGTVSFEADQGPLHPWNATIGGSAAFGKRWEAVAEYGFNFDDVQFFAGGVTWRF